MADWRFLTPQQMADQSELIVLGEYLGQQDQLRLSEDGQAVNIGVVLVQRWLKGGAPDQRIVLLVAPLPRPGGHVSSVDVPLQAGQQGLWYLKRHSPGLYKVDRPDRFVPLADATERLKLLRRQ